MILTLTLNPALDQTLFVDGLKPYDTNRVRHTETDAGGKGINLSRVAHELGIETLALGPLGGASGDAISGGMKEMGVPAAFTPIAGHTRTNLSVEDGSGNPPTTFNGLGPVISLGEWEGIVSALRKNLSGASFVAMGGSLPPGIDVTAFHDLAALVRRSGVEVVVDADGEAMQLTMEVPPDVIKPNKREAERLLGFPLNSHEEIGLACKKLSSDLAEAGSKRAVAIISMGAEGAFMASPNGIWFGEAIHVKPKSTIGSGDSMLAGVLTTFLRGGDEVEALALGLACGAATAETDGSEIGRRSEIDRLLPHAVVRPWG
ncbi:MAG: 1-phosphofructokinase family hexose kinase [Fimbriimonadaceae bacterium]|nr:1-phosphofructokinase family hexose kinase [Fimbriimonadaceae bacterium]